jgi:hypothetical protein
VKATGDLGFTDASSVAVLAPKSIFSFAHLILSSFVPGTLPQLFEPCTFLLILGTFARLLMRLFQAFFLHDSLEKVKQSTS